MNANAYSQVVPRIDSLLIRRSFVWILVCMSITSAKSLANGQEESATSPEEVKRFFKQRGKVVVTFAGYSGTGYEDHKGMLAEARNVLSVHCPRTAIVNIGATAEGIGAVYDIANEMGFETTGIVSIQAKKYDAEIYSKIDRVFYIADDSWGGFKENTQELTPTSQAMVDCSDVIVSIGGGEVARDELIAAKRAGKTIKYIPADMNHQKAIDKARKKGQPIPSDFKGAAFEVFGRDN